MNRYDIRIVYIPDLTRRNWTYFKEYQVCDGKSIYGFSTVKRAENYVRALYSLDKLMEKQKNENR